MVSEETQRRNRPNNVRSSHMRYLELRYNKPIEDLILNTIAENDCHFEDASKDLNIDKSTMTRWINRLGLRSLVDSMVEQNDHPNSRMGRKLKSARDKHKETINMDKNSYSGAGGESYS